MAAPIPIKIELDHAQKRLDLDRLTVLVQGSWEGARGGRVSGWDARYWSDTWVDPVTYTAMLRPMCLYDAWETTFTGIFARLRKTAWTLATSAKWSETGVVGNPDADTWLEGYDVAAETGVTTATWAANRPWMVSAFTFGTGTERTKIASWGWNSTASPAAGPSLDLWSDGSVDVYDDGIYLQSGSISGGSSTSQQRDAGGRALTNEFVKILLIPFRKRELLICCPKERAGFTVVFGDLVEGVVGDITPATNFWFKSWTASAKLQMAPLQFDGEGYICGELSYFNEPPETGATPDTPSIWHDLAGYGSQTVTAELKEAADASTTFVPDSTKLSAFLRFDLTGDAVSTPFVYAGMAGYGRTVTNTDGTEKADVTEFVTSAALQISERAGDVTLAVTYHDVTAITAKPVAKIRETCDRPLLASLNWTTMAGEEEVPHQLPILDGRGEHPETVESLGNEPSTYDVSVTYRDGWKALQDYMFPDSVPLDGVPLKTALEWIASCAGFEAADMDVYDASFIIPTAGGQSAGEWNCEIQAGDNAADWWDRLHENYAADWFYGFVPTATGIILQSKPPAQMEQTPSCVIYDEIADAIAARVALGESATEAAQWAHLLTYRGYRERVIPPEANEVRVTGRDPRTGKPIQAYQRDVAAMTAATVPSLRPANWKGQISRFGWVDGVITTQALAEACVTALFPQLTQPRIMAEIETSGLLFRTDGAPLWRGQVVTLNGAMHGDYRVCSFSTDFVKEPLESDPWIERPTRYVLQKKLANNEPWRGRYSAYDLATYDKLAKRIDKLVLKRGGLSLVSRPVSNVTIVT